MTTTLPRVAKLDFLHADVDECSPDSPSPHDCAQQCVNTPGGFTCECEEGYQNINDGRFCIGM